MAGDFLSFFLFFFFLASMQFSSPYCLNCSAPNPSLPYQPPPPRRTCQGAPPCHTQGIRQGACPKSSIPAKLSLTDVKLGSTRQEILTLGNHILGYRKTAAVFFDWVFGWLELEKWMNRPSSRLALLIYPKTSPWYVCDWEIRMGVFILGLVDCPVEI